ncbi:5'-nucleotidase surE,5'(3')-nucleotidase/polyphosphatase,5'/3'-nucleotidaseSurE,Survival protein SurE [Chlamydia serpentis]|uniref:5'-nucleotidase SurE n=1 Tax=Chlamydia serpentis TaxID=1967782 RepID=A0A2R8FAG1_9CHLA|nr:5'/3'-nucleotidase SurE [Chlamydia serpentis]SPN73408.1 5'-nucleotidase surE,5'(3')-nucleotidase/polyphosphatase,5'/3'-nucleotidaseSurE,Survival protein SurE [Chlamydia serpentis]
MNKRLKIILTNDDGIAAKGMSSLVSALLEANIGDIYITAPQIEQSGKSMAISLDQVICATPYTYPQPVEEAWAIGGSPADCVRLGLRALFETLSPDIVISGINSGNNICKNAWYSGTVGAAKQALIDGIPSIALSQDKHISFFQEDRAPEILKTLIMYLLSQPFPSLTGLNVNFPVSPGGCCWKGMRLIPPGDEFFYEEPQYLGSVHKDKYYVGKVAGVKVTDQPSAEFLCMLENHISVAPIFLQSSPFEVMTIKEFQKCQEDFNTFLSKPEIRTKIF